ncbi:MAG: hypothetical protein KGH61_03265 [Candidatus Micrarchaeota archaeon]|nr:hypothetical protein [Candidatus Micrarchaeota archaeon]MDE1847943.1 hypothetical protein [Candidatus Micrarchaeota archaeon]MDE1864340.1 hypothetical protein [Candidatus Micrarchaeota archaeon]
MRAQLSFEFLVYLSLAGLSLLFSVSLLSTSSHSIYNKAGYYWASALAYKINDAILSGPYLNFSTFLPQGMCNSSINGAVLHTEYGDFNIASKVLAEGKVFCPDGTEANFEMGFANGTRLIRV